MYDLEEFFKKNEIILEDGIYKYKDERKRLQYYAQRWDLPKQTPKIIVDICDILCLLGAQGFTVNQFDSPLLADLIQEYKGYSRKWSYIIADALYRIWTLYCWYSKYCNFLKNKK